MSASHAQPNPQVLSTARAAPARPATVSVLAPCRNQMHPGVYKLALFFWAMCLAVFWLTFAISANALFMVTIGTVYAAVFFGVPFIMSRMAGASSSASFSLGEFARGKFDTLYGPISGKDALLQVILVPLTLGIGGIAIGFIIRLAQVSH